MAKQKFNLSLDESTLIRLKAYARQRHATVAQIITDWIWSKGEEVDTVSYLKWLDSKPECNRPPRGR